jgi:hypothetical protein
VDDAVDADLAAGPDQDARVRADPDRAAQNRRRRHVRTGIDRRGITTMFDQHPPSLPGRGAPVTYPETNPAFAAMARRTAGEVLAGTGT